MVEVKVKESNAMGVCSKRDKKGKLQPHGVEIKELKVEIKNKRPSIIEVNREKYYLEKETTKKIDGIDHSDKLVFKKFDEEEYKENLKLVVDAISKKTTKKEIIQDILGSLDMKTLRRLGKRIKAKKPIKKHEGCLSFKIGDAFVQLVE